MRFDDFQQSNNVRKILVRQAHNRDGKALQYAQYVERSLILSNSVLFGPEQQRFLQLNASGHSVFNPSISDTAALGNSFRASPLNLFPFFSVRFELKNTWRVRSSVRRMAENVSRRKHFELFSILLFPKSSKSMFQAPF